MDIAARQLTGPSTHIILRGISVLPLHPAERMSTAGGDSAPGVGRGPPSTCHPANIWHGGISASLALMLGSGHPATPLDQLLSVSLVFIEAAESFLQKKGRDFPESQGKTCADLPQLQKPQSSARQRHQQTKAVSVAKTSFDVGSCATQG